VELEPSGYRVKSFSKVNEIKPEELKDLQLRPLPDMIMAAERDVGGWYYLRSLLHISY